MHPPPPRGKIIIITWQWAVAQAIYKRLVAENKHMDLKAHYIQQHTNTPL